MSRYAGGARGGEMFLCVFVNEHTHFTNLVGNTDFTGLFTHAIFSPILANIVCSCSSRSITYSYTLPVCSHRQHPPSQSGFGQLTIFMLVTTVGVVVIILVVALAMASNV